MKKVNFIKNSLIALFVSLFAFSCQVGLGESVDVTAPEIVSISPGAGQSVLRQFVISGHVTDNYKLAEITVDVDGKNISEKFKWSDEGWKKLDNGDWVDFTAATTSGSSKDVSFDIPFDASNAVSGNEYSIITKVTDIYNNQASKTIEEITVIIDTVEPVVSIIEPTRLSSPTHRDFASYVLKNNSVLPNIMNGTFSISGSQKEDTNLGYLVVYLDEETSIIDLSEKLQEYPVEKPVVKKVVTEELRNWTATVSSSEFDADFDLDKEHILRLVTESHDQAGNIEIKSHGWFKFNEKADIPWVSATFGFDNAATSAVVSNRVYPRCSLQGQAYDDDGLKSISIKIYDENGTTELADYSISEEQLEAEGYPTYKAWSLNALAETKTILVKVSCVDKNGIQGEEVVRYLTISDVNPPRISNITPANGSSCLGDASGSFTFTGTVDDDGSIDFVKIVRIKNGRDEDQMNYFDKDYAGWKNCKSVSSPYTDANGNKVWMLPLSTETTNAENRKVRTWNKSFNIFSDFGIKKDEKLINQKFIILAQDVGKSANIEAYTLQGDIEPPTVTIDTIYVNKDTEKYQLQDEPIELPKPFNRDGSLKITDKIKISGTWRDNSTDLWTTKSNHGDFILNVANKTVPVTVNDNGTWTTAYFEPVDSSVAVINASFEDWGGNKVNKSRSYYVNSSTPVLSRIGAETPDGSYKTGSEIKITMEFNKAVTFSGGTPVLKLNAGNGTRTATYDGKSNGTSKHIFKYTVQANDDVEKLNVTGINDDNITWSDGAATVEKTAGHLVIPTTGGASLAGGRSIVIDTKAPELSSITAISGAGWNGEGKSIFIQAKFNENVSITPEDLAGLKLVFNNGKKSGAATKTGPDTVLFKYVVGKSDSFTDKLQITKIESTGYTIADIAGNKLPSISTLPNNLPVTGSSVIKIDTDAPAAPSVKGLPAAATIYADNFTFTVDGFESGATEKKYTLDGSTWLDYTGTVTVSANGNYIINAYQTDAAGNKSVVATGISKTLNTKKIITSISAEQSDGVYTTGDEITIKVACAENMVIDTTKTGANSNSYLTLNTSPERKAYYLSGSGTKELKFKYSITDGDSCDVAKGLKVLDFVSSKMQDTSGIDISTRCDLPSGNNLDDNRTINVITGAPKVTSVTVDETGATPKLKIKFSNPVSKKVGKSIKISQVFKNAQNTVVYNAPAVLTKAQYNNFKNVSDTIDTYYEKGVNGLKADNATPDLSEKYVLKFTYDGTTEAVRNFFNTTVIDSKNNGTILDVFVPIASSNVRINASDKTEMIVDLSGSYALPVKGASYTIDIPTDIAVDDQGNTNPAMEGSTSISYTKNFTASGAEKPVIRINKAECTISGGTATQPLTAQVKLDCQTPGKTISYSISTVETETKEINDTSLPSNKTTVVAPNTAKAAVTTTGTYSTSTNLTIGSSSNKSSGYKITITASVPLTGDAKVESKEIAYRSVVRLKAGTPSHSGDDGGYDSPGNLNKVYIRGGDSESGNASTLGFPLSWNTGDFSKVKMMTQEGDYWYYVSWNISVKLYFGFLCGNVDTTDAKTMASGPLNWCWATGSWVGRKHLYPLQPGTSFSMNPVNSYNTGGYAYQKKHLEYREGGTATANNKACGVKVDSIN